MMNYVSMMPNYFCLAPLKTPTASQKEIKPFSNVLLLNTIAQALNTSLRNYQQQLNSLSNMALKVQSQTLLAKEKPNNSERHIEIIISEEEEDAQTVKPDLRQQATKILLKPTIQAEKVTNLTLQLPTDDQNLNEPKESSNKQNKESKNKNRKNRCDTNSEAFQINVPEVDLIDTAYLPKNHLSYDSLAKKKEQLMKRRVGDWNEFIKVKKERREIRMLGN